MTGVFIRTQLREDSDTERMPSEGRIGGIYKPRNAWDSQKLEEARKEPPLEPSEGAWPCQHLDFTLPASRTMRKSQWCFVTAVPGKKYRCYHVDTNGG